MLQQQQQYKQHELYNYTNYTNTSITTSTKDALFFYNRSDFRTILNNISPIRYFVEKHIQSKLEYVGLCANILCIIVLCQKNMINRKSIVYLVYLALADFMFLFLTKLPIVLIQIGLTKHDIFKTSDASCFFYDIRTTVFHIYSIILTLTVTTDRFYAIYNPLKSNQFIFSRNTKLIGIILFLISCLLSIPHAILMVHNKKENDCDAREFFRKKIPGTTINYYQIYFTFTEPFLIWFIPGLIILYMNSYVIVKILRSHKIPSKLLTNSTMMYCNEDHVLKRPSRIKFDTSVCNGTTDDTFEWSSNAVPSRKNSKTSFINNSKLSSSPFLIIKCCKNNTKGSNVNRTKYDRSYSTSNAEKSNLYSDNNSAQNLRLLTHHHQIHRQISNPALGAAQSPKANLKANTSLTSFKNMKILQNQKKLSMNNTSIFTSFDSSTSTKPHTTSQSQPSSRIKLSVNQISHYVTIIVLGFYFILSTIPYGVLLSFQNNITLKLNYYLEPSDIYKDKYWIKYGNFRQLVSCAKLFFTSNHSLNFFVYLLFNKAFRFTFNSLIYNFVGLFKCFNKNHKQFQCVQNHMRHGASFLSNNFNNTQVDNNNNNNNNR